MLNYYHSYYTDEEIEAQKKLSLLLKITELGSEARLSSLRTGTCNEYTTQFEELTSLTPVPPSLRSLGREWVLELGQAVLWMIFGH